MPDAASGITLPTASAAYAPALFLKLALYRHVYTAVIVLSQHVHTILVELFAYQNPVNNLFHNLFTFLFFSSTCGMHLHILLSFFLLSLLQR